MSLLSRYLAPTHAARPNPGHVVEWRHGEGGPWSPLDPTRPQGVPKGQVPDLLASPPVSLVQGDLARVRDPEGAVLRFLVMTGGGLVALPPGSARSLRGAMWTERMADWHRVCGYNWEKAWEGSGRPDWMLYLAARLEVDRRALALAACDCAETALPCMPSGEDRPRVALETTRRWAQGTATLQEVTAAAEASIRAAVEAPARILARAAWTVEASAESSAVWAAAEAATGAAEVATGTTTEDAARAATKTTSGAVGAAAWNAGAVEVASVVAAMDHAKATMAVLVRRRFPLWRLALALAAETTRGSDQASGRRVIPT